MRDAGDTGHTMPAAIPSITDLGRNAAAFNRRAEELFASDDDRTKGQKEQTDALYGRDEALRTLMTYYRATSLSDAATQLYVGFVMADHAVHNDLPMAEHVKCADALRRLFLSALPVVAAAAKLDLAEIAADYIVEYAEREFPA